MRRQPLTVVHVVAPMAVVSSAPCHHSYEGTFGSNTGTNASWHAARRLLALFA